MSEHAISAAPSQQSSFVTGLAWTLIVFNALGVLVLLLQNAALNLILPTLLESAPEGQEMALGLFRATGFVFLAFSVFLTYAAYALLKRRNWARVTYVIVFALAIVSHVMSALALGLGLAAGDALGTMLQGPPGSEGIVRSMMIAFIVILLAMAVVFGWLIKRLRSPAVKAEFAS
jgi:hypothetical protein